jgi:hypothetical protein
MAVQEELVIKARADTKEAQAGIKQLSDTVDHLASEQTALAQSEQQAADGATKLATELQAAAQAAAKADKGADQFSDGLGDLAGKAGKASDKVGDAADAARKAGTSMASATGGARKLSDMMREVADSADTAAGGLASKFGGAGTLAALGTVGVALAGVKMGVEAFQASAEAMFRGFGEDGQKVWDNVERSLFEIKGAFAQTVLGSDDLYKSGARLQVIYQAVAVAVKAILAPLGWLVDVFTTIIPLETLYAEELASAEEALKRKTAATTGGLTAQQQAAEQTKAQTTALQDLYGAIGPIIKTQEQLAAETRATTIATLEQKRAVVEMQLVAAQQGLTNEKLAQASSQVRLDTIAAVRAELAATYGAESSWAASRFESMKENGELESRIASAMVTKRAAIHNTITRDAQLFGNLRVALVDADQAIAKSAAANNVQAMADKMFGAPGTRPAGVAVGKATVAAVKEGAEDPDAWEAFKTSFLSHWTAAVEEGRREYEEMSDAERYANFDVPIPVTFQPAVDVPKTRDQMMAMIRSIQTGTKVTELDIRLEGLDQLATKGEKAAEALDPVAKSLVELKKGAKDLAGQQLAQGPAQLATAWAAAAASGADASSALADASQQLVATMASQWGQLFLAKGAALIFENPAAGIAYIAAGTALSALGGALGADSGTPTRGGGRGSSGESQEAEASTAAVQQQQFGYFEGGRSAVTIVTNDAASIRAMQGRLSMVAARGGSGV